MNIYAAKGFRVLCAKVDAPVPEGQEQQLEVGKTYTVERTEVSNWHTDVWLQEIPGVFFDSVCFVDQEEQSEEADRNHPDWPKYHRS